MELRLPNEPIRTPEEENNDRELLKAYFNDNTNTEPAPEVIAAYCRELRNDPDWVRLYYDNITRKNRLYTPKQHKLSLRDADV